MTVRAVKRLKHDRTIKISIAGNARSKKWKQTTLTWSEFVESLQEPRVTGETVAEYQRMTKPERSRVKDGHAFVAGSLTAGRRKAENVKTRSIVTLDVDSADYNVWDRFADKWDFAAATYSTHSHTEERPRLRLLIPLDRDVSPDEYEAIARKVSQEIDIDAMDDTTYQPERLMYYPSRSKDGIFFTDFRDRPFLSADDMLDQYDDWTDVSEWAVSSRQNDVVKRTVDKQEDPTTKRGVIGAFCRRYGIAEAIEEFLSDVYEPAGDDRYTYLGGSTGAGVVIYDDLFAYSHHSTDPVGQTLVNAFDLVRVHKFRDQDDDAKPDTPANRLPSFKAMTEWAGAQDDIKAELLEDVVAQFDEIAFNEPDEEETSLDEAAGDFLDEIEDKAWKKKLEFNVQLGKLESNAKNIRLILENEKWAKGRIAYDRFSHRRTVLSQLPWSDTDSYPVEWENHDYAGMRTLLSERYKITGKEIIKDVLQLIERKNAFHPVKDYFDSLRGAWDGEERLDTLFIDYLGAPDTEYTRAITRKSLVAAVTRVHVPGTKFDEMVTLAGAQGIGKSMLLSKIGGEWFNDSITDITGKTAAELLPGSLIIEMGELSAQKKADVEQFKQFLSKTEDKYRPAYAEDTVTHKRQCVFFATTNDLAFLRDPTGNRRFWVASCNRRRRTKTVWDDLNDAEIRQVWAEAVLRYDEGEKLQLPSHLLMAAEEAREPFKDEVPYAADVREFLEQEVPVGWWKKSDEEREAWNRSSAFDSDEKVETEPRDRTCVFEVFEAVFDKSRKEITKQESRQIAEVIVSTNGWERDGKPSRFGKKFGVQKGFSKV